MRHQRRVALERHSATSTDHRETARNRPRIRRIAVIRSDRLGFRIVSSPRVHLSGSTIGRGAVVTSRRPGGLAMSGPPHRLGRTSAPSLPGNPQRVPTALTPSPSILSRKASTKRSPACSSAPDSRSGSQPEQRHSSSPSACSGSSARPPATARAPPALRQPRRWVPAPPPGAHDRVAVDLTLDPDRRPVGHRARSRACPRPASR